MFFSYRMISLFRACFRYNDVFTGIHCLCESPSSLPAETKWSVGMTGDWRHRVSQRQMSTSHVFFLSQSKTGGEGKEGRILVLKHFYKFYVLIRFFFLPPSSKKHSCRNKLKQCTSVACWWKRESAQLLMWLKDFTRTSRTTERSSDGGDYCLLSYCRRKIADSDQIDSVWWINKAMMFNRRKGFVEVHLLLIRQSSVLSQKTDQWSDHLSLIKSPVILSNFFVSSCHGAVTERWTNLSMYCENGLYRCSFKFE